MRCVVLSAVLLVAACSGTEADVIPATTAGSARPPDQSTVAGEPPTTTQREAMLSGRPIPPAYGADGNSVAVVTGPFDPVPTTQRYRNSRILRVDLPTDEVLAVSYEDGEVRLFDSGSDTMKVRSTPSATGLVYTAGANGIDILEPLPDQAVHSRPAILSSGQLAYVTESGELVVWDGGEVGRVAVGALIDGDVLSDERGRLLVLTGPTDRYSHGVLGDTFEATGFAIVEPPNMTVAVQVAIAAPAVIEGRRALWVDFDGDGDREIQVTVSDASSGARLVVFDESGNVQSEGDAIGLGNRWRHQIAFGAFTVAPVGAEVITPHIGGIVSFLEYGEAISRVASTSSFTSHGIGSRDLDGAVALDIDGDGGLELLLPTQDRRELAAIGLRAGDAELVWRGVLDAPMSSNVAVGTRRGIPTIAVGAADGTIFLWSASE